ncbi:MAG: GNAT family N-acetyltransferase [Candidatus Bipolaricaulis anaerobius]|nr:GNAT family N-acetyltransferase [Candidatus Bipolaricaulis anaerobius]
MRELVRLGRDEMAQAAEVLAAAFRDYPLFTSACHRPEARAQLALAFCQLALHYTVRYGEVYATSPTMEGVAAWLPAAHFPMTFWKMIRSIPLPVFVGLGRHGGGRLRAAGAHLDEMRRRLAPPDHLFLFVLGVAPQFQGQGHAGRLLRPVLARLDREGRPCYVDTVNADAVPLYEHFGFRTVEKSPIPRTRLTAWALVRDPPAPAA